MNVIGHHYRAVQREALGVSSDTRFQNNHASFRGQDPAVVRTERYENAFIVALIVRKVAAIFVDSFHVGTNTTNVLHGRGRPRLHRGWLFQSGTREDNDEAESSCEKSM